MHDWRKITEQHGDQVWGTVFRILKNYDDAMDCYQDVFTEAFQKTREKSVRNLPGFLRWLAVRRGIDRLRARNNSNRCTSERPSEDIEAPTENPADSLDISELVERVRRELTKLPENQAEAFWLCCVEQISYAEVAKQMSIDKRHVAVLVHRARRRLRESLVDFRPSFRNSQ
jgi:RNA polymerase sigma-70 factor (ECF subfamily)